MGISSDKSLSQKCKSKETLMQIKLLKFSSTAHIVSGRPGVRTDVSGF